MPFQGPNFVRNQNFTRDRNAGPPDDTIQAERVDDEFNNIGAGLTTVALAAATADDRAQAASAKATTEGNAARTALRGGIEEAYDTLQKLYTWANGHIQALYTRTTNAAPAGQVGMFFLSTAPAGWLHCDGSAVSRTDHAQLFAAIGTRFGAGNGSTTFNLPDCRDEFLRGSGSTAVGVKGAQSIQSHTHGASMGAAGNHNHSGGTAVAGNHSHNGEAQASGSHSHGYSDIYPAFGGSTYAGGSGYFQANESRRTSDDGLHVHNLSINPAGDHTHGISADGTHTHGITINHTGDGETRPRFIAALVCIKA